MRPLLVLVLAVAAGCAAAADPHEAASDGVSVGTERAETCGPTLEGPPLVPGAFETDPNLAARFAALDPARAPDPVDYASETRATQMMVRYMVGVPGSSVTHADARRAGPLGDALLRAAVPAPGRLDGALLRYGLYATYLCSTPVPRSLDALVARYGDYRAWASFDVDCSRAKDGPRRIFEDHAQGVYVAETLHDGEVRETEVLFSRLRGDGQLAFAVYTETGALTDRSTFATGSGTHANLAAPFTCMTCHVDSSRGTFTKRMPLGTGAGCETDRGPADPGIWALP